MSSTSSGFSSTCSNTDFVMYAPCLRMAGMTSWVIQRLNAFASGLREVITSEYSPGSLMIAMRCFPPRVSIVLIPFSSSSRRSTVMLGFPSSSALHTSAATNHGSPLRFSVRTFPKASFSKIISLFSIVQFLSCFVMQSAPAAWWSAGHRVPRGGNGLQREE